MSPDLSKLSPKEYILIKGAKLHNLKNIDVAIPRHKLIVITGLSGSGKSSLAFDTLYAEGQRRYVESLSSYARQFLGRLHKPNVDYIKGIAPAIAIEQKVNSTNPRSTVGTTTEIYDYLKLLFARVGKTISPSSNNVVKRDTTSDVINYIKTLNLGDKLLLLSPIQLEEGRTLENKLQALVHQGFSRIKIGDSVERIELVENFKTSKQVSLVVDRIIVKQDQNFYNRLADAVEMAFFEGKGRCILKEVNGSNQREFSNSFELDGQKFLEPNTHLFSFNNPYGACTKCEGYGDVIGIDKSLVIPNTSLSIYENALFPWRGETMKYYRDLLINNSHKFNFPIHKPYFELEAKQKKLIWEGNSYFTGLNTFFEELESKAYKVQNRVMLSRYRGKTQCNVCKGKRLREEANYVKIGGASISDLVEMSLKDLKIFFNNLELNDMQKGCLYKYDSTMVGNHLYEPHHDIGEKGFLTAIYYINSDYTEDNWVGGELTIYKQLTFADYPENSINILPKQNRLIVFPGYMIHRVKPYFGDNPRTSMVIGWAVKDGVQTPAMII